MCSADRNRAGFTLLEALIALAILAGAVASFMMVIAANHKAQSEADADLAAALNLRTVLAQVGRDIPLEVGMQSGVLADGQAWSAIITPFMPERGNQAAADPTIFQIQIKLRKSAAGPSYVEVASLKRALK